MSLGGDCMLDIWVKLFIRVEHSILKKACQYDQEMPQSHTADQPTAPWGRATDHFLSQSIKKAVNVKQAALSLSFPSRWLQS